MDRPIQEVINRSCCFGLNSRESYDFTAPGGNCELLRSPEIQKEIGKLFYCMIGYAPLICIRERWFQTR